MLKIAYHHIYRHKLVENHRFPMIKYELIPEQLIREGVCNDDNFFTPIAIQDNDILIDQINDHNDSISITNYVKPDFNQHSSYNDSILITNNVKPDFNRNSSYNQNTE